MRWVRNAEHQRRDVSLVLYSKGETWIIDRIHIHPHPELSCSCITGTLVAVAGIHETMLFPRRCLHINGCTALVSHHIPCIVSFNGLRFSHQQMCDDKKGKPMPSIFHEFISFFSSLAFLAFQFLLLFHFLLLYGRCVDMFEWYLSIQFHVIVTFTIWWKFWC